jgi:hypothetical protein
MRRILGAGALTALGFCAFAPTLWSKFAADDFLLRYAAIHTHFTKLLTADPLAFQGGGKFFRPIWFAYDGILTAISNNPALYHSLNIVLYAAVIMEVWLLLRAIVSPLPAAAAAGMFAVYPRHTEAVSWYAGSMDLLPAFFGLAAVLVALQRWNRPLRLTVVVVLAALAAASKENAYLLAPLFALVQVARREPLRGRSGEERVRSRKAVWEPTAGMLLGGLAAGIWRLAAFHKLGGYTSHPWTLFRIVAAAGSDILAAASPPQLPLLINLALIGVPIAIWLSVIALGSRVARRWPERRRVLFAGLAFAVVALLPTLNVAVNLNTATDERFLFLPSVGLAIALAGGLPPKLGPKTLASLGLIAAVFLGFSIDGSLNWQRGSVFAARLANQVTQLAQAKGELLLLSAPETYRNSSLLTPGLDAAVALQGGQARVAWCSVVDVRKIEAHQVAFDSNGPMTYVGTTLGSARFHFPLGGASAPAPLTPDCTYGPGPKVPHLGSAASVTVRPLPAARPARLAFFDGKNIVALAPRR